METHRSVVWWALIRAPLLLSLCPLLLGSGHEASLGGMADDDDVAEDWEDVDTEVRKLLTKECLSCHGLKILIIVYAVFLSDISTDFTL